MALEALVEETEKMLEAAARQRYWRVNNDNILYAIIHESPIFIVTIICN